MRTLFWIGTVFKAQSKFIYGTQHGLLDKNSVFLMFKNEYEFTKTQKHLCHLNDAFCTEHVFYSGPMIGRLKGYEEVTLPSGIVVLIWILSE